MNRLMNINEVVSRVGICKTTIYQMMSDGIFPLCVKPTPTMSRWRSKEIDNWENELPKFIGTQNGN